MKLLRYTYPQHSRKEPESTSVLVEGETMFLDRLANELARCTPIGVVSVRFDL